jgi:PKD repeat protein
MKKNAFCCLILHIFLTHQANAQCDVNAVASYAIVDNLTEICEGQAIQVDNKCDEYNTPSCIDYMIWDWGDGIKDTVSDFNNKFHTYNYPPFNGTCAISDDQKFKDIKLSVVYHNGKKHYEIAPVKVNPKPHALFSIPTPICIDHPTVSFSNNSCYADSYMWEITKLPSSTVIQTFDTATPSFTFPSSGDYSVKLIAKNNCGTSPYVQIVTVKDAPVAMAHIQINNNCAPATALLSSAGTQNQVSYTWSISSPNGGMWMWADTSFNAHSPNPKVIFKTAGTYNITLTVHGAPQCQDATFSLVQIIKDSPVASWTGVPLTGCLQNGKFTFDPNASAINSGGYNNLTYQWFFPGGMPAIFAGQDPPPVMYTQTGSYKILMVLTGDSDPANPCGRDTLAQTLKITNESTVAVSTSGIPANGCGPFTVIVNNTSTGAGGWEWTILKNNQPAAQPADVEFLNGTNKDSINPVIRFKTAGDYLLKLQLENVACGTNTTWQQMISVKTAPSFSLATPPSACVPAQINFGPYLTSFNNGNDPATTLHWIFAGGMPAMLDGPTPAPVGYTQPGMATVICSAINNTCGPFTDTIHFDLIGKTQVVVTPAIDSLCKNGQPIQLTTNLISPGWPSNAPGGSILPQNLNDGWNDIVVTNVVTDPGCQTKDTTRIYILNEPTIIGTLANFCDTIGTAQIIGYMPAQNIHFYGGNYVSPTGLVNAALAGFGQHKVYIEHNTSALGCIFKDSLTVNVFKIPKSGINAPKVGCVLTDVPFSFPLDSTGLKFSWDFGDGSGVSSKPNPVHQYQQAGTYTVSLQVTNADNCADKATFSIDIEAPLSFELTVDPLEACAGVPVQVTCQVTGAGTPLSWNLYEATIDTLPNFTTGMITFPSGIKDTVYQLTVSGSNACPVVSKSVPVLIHPLPRAILGATTLTPCSGDTIYFNANQSTGAPFTAVHFNDGNGFDSAALPAAGRRYFANGNKPGIYYPIYTVTNGCGTSIDTVKITALPENIIPFVQLSDTLLCVGDTLILTSFAADTVTGKALHVSYQFSNGTFINQANAKYVCTAPGYIRITQWVTDECAWDSITRWIRIRPAPLADFSWMPDSICAGAPASLKFLPNPDHLQVLWYADGVKIGSGIQTSYAWQTPGWKNIGIKVKIDTTGCTAMIQKNIHIRENPAPKIISNEKIGCGSLRVLFTATNLGAGLFSEWTFSDGTTDVGSPVWHTFSDVGLFKAHLHTEDTWGCSGEAVQDSFLVNPLPKSTFSTSSKYGCGVPDTIVLKNQTQGALGTRWFVDNVFVSNKNDTTLVFTTPGFYRIKLVSVNKFGCIDSASYIYQVFPNLIAKARLDSALLCQFHPLQFQNLSQNADNWLWYFGNGDTSSAKNPLYSYQVSGTYQVVLVAKQGGFCSDTFKFKTTFTILSSPTAGFSVSDQFNAGLANGTIICKDSSKNAVKWRYDFIDLSVFSTDRNPIVQYTFNFEKTIVQTVYNSVGCFDTITVRFTPALFGGLVVPTAIEPYSSKPGLHTVFRPVGAGLRSYKIEVFSPAGDLVWFSDVLEDGAPTGMWDGKDFSGKDCPPGAYLWKAEATLENTPDKGRGWKGMPVEKGSERFSSYGTVTIIR